MKILILALKTQMDSTQSLLKAFENVGCSTMIKTPSQARKALDRKPGPIWDLVIPRLGSQSLQEGLLALQQIEKRRIPVLNSSTAIQLANDKWACHRRWNQLKLPNVPTILCQPEADFSAKSIRWPNPYFIKLRHGSQGKGVTWATNSAQLQATVDLLRTSRTDCLVQPRQIGAEYRVLIFNQEILGCIRRKNSGQDWRGNLHAGGTGMPGRISSDEKKICLAATRSVGLQLAGVDFIRHKTGSQLLEINAFPGFAGIGAILGQDFAQHVASRIKLR